MRYSERKLPISEHRRKILNLLEFILEMEDDIEVEYGVNSVFNVFARRVMYDDRSEFTYVTDEQWATRFQAYADHLLSKTKGCN
jgi:hypothetical protein